MGPIGPMERLYFILAYSLFPIIFTCYPGLATCWACTEKTI